MALKLSNQENEERDKPLSGAVTERFIQSMLYIIATDPEVDNQVNFARKMGFTPQNLTLMKAGTRNVMLESVVRLCMDFGVSTEWMLLGKGEMFPVKKSVILKEIEELKNRIDKLESKKA